MEEATTADKYLIVTPRYSPDSLILLQISQELIHLLPRELTCR